MAACLLLAPGALGLGAHENGVLRLASSTFSAGDSLGVTGAKFAKRDDLTIALVGAAGRVTLGEVTTDSSGTFRRRFFIPANTAVGPYRLVAEAIDGDEVATLDVVVRAAASAMPMPMPAGMEHEGMQMAPTGEPLALDRARNGVVTGAAIVFILACAGGGAALLRRPRTHPSEDHA